MAGAYNRRQEVINVACNNIILENPFAAALMLTAVLINWQIWWSLGMV
jgi:hypothetical protein